MARQDLVPALLAEQAAKSRKLPVDATDEDRALALIGAMQPHQRALFESENDHDAVIAPRQTGKSWGILLMTFAKCLRRPEAQWAIIGPTLESLKRNYLTPFRIINRKFELGVRFNKTERAFHFPNGSVVYFIGADKLGESDKLRGAALHGAVVDESQYFTLADFDYLLSDVLEAATAARKGRIIIIGTPGSVLQGEFYLATCTPPEFRIDEDGNLGPPTNYPVGTPQGDAMWCKHTWNPKVNAAAPHIWEKALRIKKQKGYSDDHPTWRREWLGQWVAVNDELVYRYSCHKNSYRAADLPELPGGQRWKTVLGVDLGATDGTAMVVWAYSPHHPAAYELYSLKQVKTDLQAINVTFIAKWRNQLAEEYGPFEREVCDPGGLADIILETLLDDHGIYWEKAAVRQKEDHIEILNDDLDARRVFCLSGSILEAELIADKWKKDRRTGLVPPRGERKEDDAIPNDAADAGLYGYRWLCHRRYTTPVQRQMSDLELFLKAERDSINAKYRQRAQDAEDPCLNLN